MAGATALVHSQVQEGGEAVSANDKAAAAWDDYIDQQQEEEVAELQNKIKQLQTTIKELEEINEYLRDKIEKLEYRRLDK